VYKTDDSYAFVENYLKSIDYDITDATLDAEHYVSHPVNPLLYIIDATLFK
jgi:hypothetical protein